MADDVGVVIAGKVFRGWTQVGVTQAMDAAAGAFTLSYTGERTDPLKPWPIAMGDEAIVQVAGEVTLTGYVNKINPRFDADTLSFSAEGRDKAGDAVDCSAYHEPDEWRNLDLLQIAKKLLAPFGVPVKVDTGVDIGKKFELVKLQEGEKVVDAINRYCLIRKILLMPDSTGGILLTRVGSRRAEVELIEGVNIFAASGSQDDSNRYSDYIIKAQAPYSPDSDVSSEAHITAKAVDQEMKDRRYRPLVFTGGDNVTSENIKSKAEWEAAIRLGQSSSARITVHNWRQKPGGPLWRPNTLVYVNAPFLKMQGEMLIRQVTFVQSGTDGTVTDLEIVSPLAYSLEPPKKPKKSKGDNPWLATSQ
jgi:prophage tail gpP-like protein